MCALILHAIQQFLLIDLTGIMPFKSPFQTQIYANRADRIPPIAYIILPYIQNTQAPIIL